MGLEQVIEGARRRALAAMSSECDFSVGLEAGLYAIGGEPFDVEAAYVLSRDGRWSLGLSPSFPVPKWIYEGVLRGRYRELEEAVEDFYGARGVGDREGFIGILTRGVCVRSVLSYYATLMALVKFLNEDAYQEAGAPSR
jgi:inosine/xanthosine triphosphatase